MSDRRLRELERRGDAFGAPADRARSLSERLRAGAVSRPEVLLAAFLGDPAARAALGGAPPEALTPLAPWLRALGELARACPVRHGTLVRGKELVLRAALAAAEAVLAACPDDHLGDLHGLEAATCEAVAAWLDAPDDAERRLAIAERGGALEAAYPFEGEPPHTATTIALARAALHELVGAQENAVLARACHALGEDAVRQVVGEALVPRLLSPP